MEDTEKRDTQNDGGRGGREGEGGLVVDVSGTLTRRCLLTQSTHISQDTVTSCSDRRVDMRRAVRCGAVRCGVVRCGVVRGSVLRSGQPHWEPDWTREEGREDGS